MRGKGSRRFCSLTVARITPAYAGKSLCRSCRYALAQDHPRLCGEKLCSCRWQSWRMGSPPPMRGKVSGSTQQQRRRRITPAYAGKSVFISKISTFFEDHPRLCGEKQNLESISWSTAGSPPPMRGKGRFCMMRLTQCGITPAYAGKSYVLAEFCWYREDHPRLCGEKEPCPHRQCNNAGSPPPMRGKD